MTLPPSFRIILLETFAARSHQLRVSRTPTRNPRAAQRGAVDTALNMSFANAAAAPTERDEPASGSAASTSTSTTQAATNEMGRPDDDLVGQVASPMVFPVEARSGESVGRVTGRRRRGNTTPAATEGQPGPP